MHATVDLHPAVCFLLLLLVGWLVWVVLRREE